jgi:hypothetical protein
MEGVAPLKVVVPLSVTTQVMTEPAANDFWQAGGESLFLLQEDELNYTCDIVTSYEHPDQFTLLAVEGMSWDLQSFLKKCFGLMFNLNEFRAIVVQWDSVSSVCVCVCVCVLNMASKQCLEGFVYSIS